MDFIAGRLRFAFYVRKGIANIPVSKEGTYSRRLGPARDAIVDFVRCHR